MVWWRLPAAAQDLAIELQSGPVPVGHAQVPVVVQGLVRLNDTVDHPQDPLEISWDTLW